MYLDPERRASMTKKNLGEIEIQNLVFIVVVCVLVYILSMQRVMVIACERLTMSLVLA